VVGVALFLGQVHWTLVWLPLGFVPLICLTLGLAWLLASLGVFLRDIGHTTILVTQMLFFLTPIFYDVHAPYVPELMRRIMLINPLATIVETFRRTILWGDSPPWAALSVVTAVSFLVLAMGYAWFVKSRKAFSDVL
jgi:lipopolysaccharide transport system permease protein